MSIILGGDCPNLAVTSGLRIFILFTLLMSFSTYNYSSGPAMIPAPIYEQIDEVLRHSPAPVPWLELGHRTPEFAAMADRSEQNLRDLLTIPDDYVILFLAGGASMQYASVPLNLGTDGLPADYLNTGHWSECAISEARSYTEVNVVSSVDGQDLRQLPERSSWHFSGQASYFHFVDNETLTGFELPAGFIHADCPLVSDMTSNFLGRWFDIEKFGLVYAGTQKNLGIAGLAVVILRRDLLGRAHSMTPVLQNYTLQAQAHSLCNTPPIFTWYVCSLVLEWIQQQGGVKALERNNRRKARCLYECIENSAIYVNNIAPSFRSNSNVHFYIRPPELEPRFLEHARQQGFFGLRGHRAVGGIRASIYNAMPMEGIRVLVEFMREFERVA